MNNNIPNNEQVNAYKCIRCGNEVAPHDVFCCKCGCITTYGNSYVTWDNNKQIIDNGRIIKKKKRLFAQSVLCALMVIAFVAICFAKHLEFYYPIFKFEKIALEKINGYKSVLTENDRTYYGKKVESVEEAKELIAEDYYTQELKCKYTPDKDSLEEEIEKKYDIAAVHLCDISDETVKKMETVLDRMYTLFPSIKGYLTNISVDNLSRDYDGVATFVAYYPFVNDTLSINNFNKVYKTEILLNSKYFLNDSLLKKDTPTKYVGGGTNLDSLAHYLGKYVAFTAVIKKHQAAEFILETSKNTERIEQTIKDYQNDELYQEIVKKSFLEYQSQTEEEVTFEKFLDSISKKAGEKIDDHISRETIIAEAIYDYYLHNDKAAKASLIIVNTLKEDL